MSLAMQTENCVPKALARGEHPSPELCPDFILLTQLEVPSLPHCFPPRFMNCLRPSTPAPREGGSGTASRMRRAQPRAPPSETVTTAQGRPQPRLGSVLFPSSGFPSAAFLGICSSPASRPQRRIWLFPVSAHRGPDPCRRVPKAPGLGSANGKWPRGPGVGRSWACLPLRARAASPALASGPTAGPPGSGLCAQCPPALPPHPVPERAGLPPLGRALPPSP